MINTIKYILLDIAKTHTPKQAQWLKCFVQLDKATDFNEANFGKNRQDYQNGDYWTRKPITWNEDCKQYPALTFEWMPTNIRSIQDRSLSFTVMINVVSLYECAEVNNMSRHEVDLNILKVLLSVIEQMKKYNLYIVSISGEPYKMWLTKEQAQAYLDAGKIQSFDKKCTGIFSIVDVGQINLQKTWFGVDKLRSVQAELSFSECDPQYDDFDYIQVDTGLPTTICTKC